MISKSHSCLSSEVNLLVPIERNAPQQLDTSKNKNRTHDDTYNKFNMLYYCLEITLPLNKCNGK